MPLRKPCLQIAGAPLPLRPIRHQNPRHNTRGHRGRDGRGPRRTTGAVVKGTGWRFVGNGASLTDCLFDGVAEDIEHAREDALAHRRLQRSAHVLHRQAARETLGGRQGNPAHPPRIQLRQHLDDDLLSAPFSARAQYRVNRRQVLIEPDIDDAAAHRDDDAGIRRTGAISISLLVFTRLRLFRHGARGRRGPQGLAYMSQPSLDPRPVLRGGEASTG